MRFLAALVPLGLLVAACGSGDDDATTAGSKDPTTTSSTTTTTSTTTTAPPPDTTPTTTAPPAPPASTSLSVEATADGAPFRSGSVTCGDPASGDGHLADQASAAAACDLLRSNAEAVKLLVEGPPTDQVCTYIYGGPEEALVHGQINGQAVHVSIDRTDGCGISDWDMLVPLLGPAGV